VSPKKNDEAAVLKKVIDDLQPLTTEEQQNIVNTISTFYKLHLPAAGAMHGKPVSVGIPASHPAGGGFSESRDISPKEFIMQKQPRTDVERVTCLAYYLTHFRSTGHFKTVDISKLNVESAQSKLSNPTVAVDNATKLGYLAPATKGNKQISGPGELYVQALPDREAAKAAIANAKRGKRKTTKKKK
jgi:hypothetical protein